jgi:hypothetical protein
MNDVPTKEGAGPPANDPKVTTEDHSVTYTFPDKVLLVGALTNDDFEKIEDRIWADINDAMNRGS